MRVAADAYLMDIEENGKDYTLVRRSEDGPVAPSPGEQALLAELLPERNIHTTFVDPTDPEAVELALSYSQGRAIVNSINLEDGEARFRAVVPLLVANL